MTKKQREMAADLMRREKVQLVVRPYGLAIGKGCCESCCFNKSSACPFIPGVPIEYGALLCQGLVDNDDFKVYFEKVS